MQLKKIKIANLVARNNVFLASLAGYTNCVFRKMCYDLGAGLTFTEMVSAKGLFYNSKNTRELLMLDGQEGIRAVQLFGSDPYYMRKAAESQDIAPFELIDINMGCPMPKIFNNGEGSALLKNIPLAQKIVSECKKSGKAVSVKFRIGIDAEHIITRDFAVAMRDAGADMITIHGRTRDKIYSGEVDYNQISLAKSAVEIPVIANGGIFSASDAEKLMSETGADGVAVARAALSDPFIFAQLTGGGAPDKKAYIRRQLSETFRLFDERFATVYMRKMLAFYSKGLSGAAALKLRLFACKSKEEIESILEEMPL